MRNSISRPVLILLTSLCLVLTAACCSPCKDTEQNKEVVKQAAAALDAYDYDAMDAVMAQDYKRHCQATPEATVESLNDFKELVREWEVTMPDAKMNIEFMIAEGDKVAIWGTYRATTTGSTEEIAAGKQVEIDFGGVHRLVDGKIVETWVTWDNVTMLQQLGMFPKKEGEAGEAPAETS